MFQCWHARYNDISIAGTSAISNLLHLFSWLSRSFYFAAFILPLRAVSVDVMEERSVGDCHQTRELNDPSNQTGQHSPHVPPGVIMFVRVVVLGE